MYERTYVFSYACTHLCMQVRMSHMPAFFFAPKPVELRQAKNQNGRAFFRRRHTSSRPRILGPTPRVLNTRRIPPGGNNLPNSSIKRRKTNKEQETDRSAARSARVKDTPRALKAPLFQAQALDGGELVPEHPEPHRALQVLRPAEA